MRASDNLNEYLETLCISKYAYSLESKWSGERLYMARLSGEM